MEVGQEELSCGHWSLLQNTGAVCRVSGELQEDIQEVSKKCSVVPEVGDGGAVGQESLELEIAPRRRPALQLEPQG